ncbi:thioredoxin [Candidatus Pacearchaeota archaeon]|nr:thioredoxin [Candidatus Pacearchaeota archaeon]
MKEENIIELTERNFDKTVAKGNWVIDFWAAWCGPCRIMGPHLREAAKELRGKVNFAKVNVEEENGLANRFQVMSIPTTMFFKDGEQANRAIGAMRKESIIKMAKDSF